MENERTLVLQMVADKKLTVAEAIELLKALDGRPGVAPELGAKEPLRIPELPFTPPPPIPEDLAGKIGSLVESIIGNFGFGFGEGYKFEETYEGDFDGSADEILVDFLTQNGRIGIETWDKPGYMVKLIKRVQAASEQEARQRSENWTTIERQGNRLSIQMIPQGIKNQGMAIMAYLPKSRKYAMKLQTANGRIELDGITASTILGRTANGLIRMDHATAEAIEARTSNGKILLRSTASQVQASSSNGKVIIVPLELAAVAQYDLNTSNGSVRVGVPTGDGVAFSVDLHVSNGKIDVGASDLVYEVNEKRLGARTVKAKSPGFDTAARKVSVTAHTSNGSIIVGKADWE